MVRRLADARRNLDELTRVGEAASVTSALRNVITDLEWTVAAGAQERQRADSDLESIAANLLGAFYRCRNDPQWTILFTSRGIEELTGYEPQAFLSGSVHMGMLIHPDDSERVWDQVQAALGDRRRYELDYRITGKDGTERVVRERGAGVWSPGGDLLYLEGHVSDVTERVAAERESRRKHERLERLIATTQDALVFIDAESRITRFNAAAEAIFGYPAAEVIGQRVEVLMPEPYRSEHAGYMARYSETGEPRAIGRIRTVTGRRKGGEEFPMELSVTDVAVEGDVGFAAFVRDVSERERMQRDLVEKERLATVGTTASMFAHEIGNPLNNMFLHVQMLKRRLVKMGLADELGSRLDGVVGECKRLNGLLDDFRSYYAREPMSTEPVDVRDLLEDVLASALRGGPEAPVAVRVNVPARLPAIHANVDELRQVFANLVKNAVEAMPTGGTLGVLAEAGEERVTIHIEDTGYGIPADFDAFEPFKSTKPRSSGLGLPIVERIVSAHGGTVTYSSEAEAGTHFTVVLPTRATARIGATDRRTR